MNDINYILTRYVRMGIVDQNLPYEQKVELTKYLVRFFQTLTEMNKKLDSVRIGNDFYDMDKISTDLAKQVFFDTELDVEPKRLAERLTKFMVMNKLNSEITDENVLKEYFLETFIKV